MSSSRARFFLVLMLVALASAALGASCKKPRRVFIDSPASGTFTLSPSVQVDGRIKNVPAAQLASFTVNGVPVAVNPDNTWSTTVTLDQVGLITPIVAQATTAAGNKLRDRVTVIYGDSIADGSFTPMGVALRIADPGLDELEPLISSQVDLNPATLLPVGTVVINDFCAVDGGFLGCLGSVDAVIANPAPSISGFGIGLDAVTNSVDGDIFINDLRVQLNINGSGLAPSCGLRLDAAQTNVDGTYALQPLAGDPSTVDVVQLGNVNVSFQNFQQTFTSGLCDFPLIGSLIQLIIGDIRPTVESGFENFLNTVDPQGNTPVAAAVEVALAAIEISGPIGQAIGVNLETPLFDVFEDVNGVTLDSDARITASLPDPNAVDQLASYHVSDPFPSFGPTTPVLGQPYDMAIGISTSAFNQLLKSEVESGLLITTITELDLFGSGPLPLTAGFLAMLVPEFGVMDPATPVEIDVQPTLAPFVTGVTGPGGEITEMRVPHLTTVIREAVNDVVLLEVAVDAAIGLDVDFTSGQLAFNIGDLDPGSLNVDILRNTLTANEFVLDNIFTVLLPELLPSLATSLGTFPLPDFLGLGLSGIEVSKTGEFVTIYVDLVPVP